ncbi:MAG TPA: tetratricopeptide repeat protein [Burkholderiales bacterium]|nr:tetratricopeptide repeat protein [Burkholderiales bacterium]
MTSIDTFEAMLTGGKDSALVRYSLGNEYYKLEQYEKSAEHLQKAVEHDPKYSGAWKLLGKALAHARRKDEAAQAFQQGIEVAQGKGDIQAAKEMTVYLNRLKK